MLQPDHRVLLTEALRPPPGFVVDHAVATTYSLSLTAALIAPMAFAATDTPDMLTAVEQPTIHMLDALQRYVEQTTVFVQAGGIHVPPSHSRVLTFLEDSIQEVEPPESSGTFHPKVWAVRYVDDANRMHHRLIVASRNLTLDESWDTMLVLEEDPTGTIDAQPAADFLMTLPDLTIREMPDPRKHNVQDLAKSLAGRAFNAPPEYTHGQLLPMGTTHREWDFPTQATNALVISPFLSASTLHHAAPHEGNAVLVSRAEALDELGKDQLSGWHTRVLHASLDTPGEDANAPVTDGFDESTGLHAKTAVYDLGNNESITVTGSANFTTAAWHRNVEFNTVLYGPTDRTGTEAILGKTDDQLGLSAVLEPYEPAQLMQTPDAERQLRYDIENFHRQLARTQPQLDLTILDQQTVSARLDLGAAEHRLASKTRIWPSTVPGDKRILGETRPWEIAPVNVTSFLAIETTVGSVVRRCVLTCRLTGEAVDRRRAALAAILSTPERVLQYIALLMGTEAPSRILDDVDTQRTGIQLPTTVPSHNAHSSEPVLFEPLLHATRTPQELARIAAQIEELRTLPAADELLPAGFFEMWDTVIAATLSGRGT